MPTPALTVRRRVHMTFSIFGTPYVRSQRTKMGNCRSRPSTLDGSNWHQLRKFRPWLRQVIWPHADLVG